MALERDDSHESEAPEVMPPNPKMPKSFLAFLAEQGSGELVNELSEQLRDVVERIEMHFDRFRGKVVGELNLKCKLILEGGAYKVIVEYGVKVPKAPAAGTIMWLGQDGNLSPTNPKQLAMPFGHKSTRGVG